MARVAIILAGCGHLDGAEIHESVLTLLALDQEGIAYQCYSLDKKKARVMCHITNKATPNQERNIMQESARIARGNIKRIEALNVDEYDALVLPGGFGVALNFSNFERAMHDCAIDPLIEELIQAFYKQKKPILAICISPVLVARALRAVGAIKITLGSSEESIQLAQKLNMKPIACKNNEVCYDQQHKIITTAGYMEPADLKGMFEGIKKAVNLLKKIL